MSFPAPDPVSGVGQASRFWPTLVAAMRTLFRREEDPLELIAREQAALGDRYWPDATPALPGEEVLRSTTEMTLEELRWRLRVRRVRDILGLIALTSVTVILVAFAWHAISPFG
jgi:hypothetical protein